jgi:RNA polymerase sigma-70 factor (ECF subfamily)
VVARHVVVSLPSTFEGFVGRVEPRLRRALCATYGVEAGREATVDALSYAWEHWERIGGMDNPVGYLYRVGQSSARRQLRQLRVVTAPDHDESVEVEPGLERALAELSEQQRAVVMLVHGYGWTLKEVSESMALSVATVRTHLGRGLRHLRRRLEVDDVTA